MESAGDDVNRADDPVFLPGDKVVRVGSLHPDHVSRLVAAGYPKLRVEWGKVYCVMDCWMSPFDGTPRVRLSGIDYSTTPQGNPCGFATYPFRKVEEVGHPAVAIHEQEPITQ